MTITKVEAENLKGRSFAYDLSPQVAIVGDNFTGKTSVIDAIRLCLIGYLPELGKLPKATRQLCSGDFMTARLEFDDGSDATFETNGEHKRDFPALIEEIPLLNASAYFAMSERERYQYVFGIAKIPDSFSRGSITSELQGLAFDSAQQPAKDKIIAFATGALEGRSVQDGLQLAIDELAGHFKYFNARSKDTQGAIRVLTELKNRQEAMAGNAKQFADNEVIARTAAQTAYKAVGDVQNRLKEMTRYREREQRVKELRGAVESTDESDKLERLIKEAAASLKPDMQSEYSEADLEAQKWAHSEAMKRFTEHSMKLQDFTEQRNALETQTACPHCGAKGRSWKGHLQARLDESILFQRGAVDGSARTLAERKTEMDAVAAHIKLAEENRVFNRQTNERILGWQAQLDKLARNRVKWNEALEKEEKDLADNKPQPATPLELSAAMVENDKAEATYKLARQKLKEAELLEQDIKRAAQAQLEHENAAAHVVVIKTIGKTLREKQAQLVDMVFGGLLTVANGIVGEILATPLAFHEGEVGRWDGHRWISHKTFSGTEQALTFVAIAAALSQAAPIRLLIFDELGRLDPKRRNLIIAVLKNAMEKSWLDQFIVAGAVELETLHPAAAGMQVIEL